MEKLVPKIREIAERIVSTEDKRKRLAAFLRNVGPKMEVFSKLEPDKLDGVKIVGVDGGIAKKSLHGFDCVIVRAAGACFMYEKGKVSGVEYFPSQVPSIKPEITEALSDLDWAYYTSIARMNIEVETAIECMERFSPDLLLMDGSIVPHHADKPSRKSEAHKGYMDLVRNFERLYDKSLKKGILLAGVIEDSRGVRFCNIVKSDVISRVNDPAASEASRLLEKSRDTNILYWVMEKGERSMVFPYSDNPKEHLVLRDFEGKYINRIRSFYLKTAKFDRPVRVDFLGKQEDRIASIILAISGHHSGYGLPAPLIEADNVSKLSESEIENLYDQITALTGNLPGVMRLRREQRPF